MKFSGLYYDPSPECIAKLNSDWCASYSGGKDSTSLVGWIEFLRRAAIINVKRPQLVQCNTSVEEQHLEAISREMTSVLRSSGWECAIVEPDIREKLYCQILGRGLTPVHPGGGRFMRWCTRSTKIDPMNRWRKTNSSGLVLTGLRIGESAVRDAKLAKRGIGCSAGGECGIPPSSDNTFSPIINWSMCNVVDWLSGIVYQEVADLIGDILPITKKLVSIYNVSLGQDGFEDWAEREVSAARFGCIGCPAISSTRCAPKSTVKRNGPQSPLNEIYDVWFEARRRDNRLFNRKTGGRGPIKMAVRKLLFARIMDIQKRSGVVLIGKEEIAFIKDCWKRSVYPRGWSAADELVTPVDDSPLFDALSQ